MRMRPRLDSERPWRRGLYGRALLSRDTAGMSLTSWVVSGRSALADEADGIDVDAASIVAVLELTPSGHWYSGTELSPDTRHWLAAEHPELHPFDTIEKRWSLAARTVLRRGELLRGEEGEQ